MDSKTMDQSAPTPEPGVVLTAASVKLLRAGDLLFVRSYGDAQKVCRLLEDPSADAGALRVDEEGQSAPNVWNIHRFTFIGRPDANGWIAWNGGENPVPGQIVDVRFRDGYIGVIDPSEAWEWGASDAPQAIIAYRLSRPTAATPAPSEGDAPAEVGGGDDAELPDTPMARAIYRHFSDVHGLHPDEAADSTGALLESLAALPPQGAGVGSAGRDDIFHVLTCEFRGYSFTNLTDEEWEEIADAVVDRLTALRQSAAPAAPSDKLKVAVAEALAAHDAMVAECRIDGSRPQRNTSAECDLCGAKANEGCGRKRTAAYQFIKAVRAASALALLNDEVA